jgi:hypothetical protein
MKTLLLHGTNCEIFKVNTDTGSHMRIGHPGRLDFQSYRSLYIGDRHWEIKDEDVISRKYIIQPVRN